MHKCKAEDGCERVAIALGYCLKHYKRLRKHGTADRIGRFGTKSYSLYYHPLRTTWMRMIERCHDHTRPAYKWYGARGIKVCERWLDFRSFLADMGERPSKSHSLDRIDNDGNYEPGNCRWADQITQGRNRRGLKLSEAKADELRSLYASGATTTELAKRFGITMAHAWVVAVRRSAWKHARTTRGLELAPLDG